ESSGKRRAGFFERSRDVIAERQAELRRRRDHTGRAEGRQNRDQAADELVVGGVRAAGRLDRVEVGRRGGVGGDQRTEANESVRLPIEVRLCDVGPLRRNDALDVRVVADRQLPERAFVCLHRSTYLTPPAPRMYHPAWVIR